MTSLFLESSHLLFTFEELSEVPEVVSLHLEIENFAVSSSRRWNQSTVQQVKNRLTDLSQLIFNLDSVI